MNRKGEKNLDNLELKTLQTSLYNLKIMAQRDELGLYSREIEKMEGILFPQKSPEPQIIKGEKVHNPPLFPLDSSTLPSQENSALIVNGEIIVRKIYQSALGDHLNLCRTAGTAKLALQLLETTPFKVALVADNLPDMKVFDFVDLLRKNLADKKLTPPHILFCLEDGSSEQLQKCQEKGGFGVVVNPVSLDQLLPLVFKALGRDEDH